MTPSVLVTGAAGFIGAHVAAALADAGLEVVASDRGGGEGLLGRLRHDRVAHFLVPRGVPFELVDLADGHEVEALFARHRFDRVVHLAAQAGVRYSVEAPQAFVQSNLVAFGHVLEACRRAGIEHLVYASSSSVYGAREEVPFREDDRADAPTSLYAATKRANELMAHAYAHLHRLPCTALRFFTVYGPWGRPDMAYFEFAQRIRRGEPITVYGRGELRRDFTYVDDIVEGVRRIAAQPCAALGLSAPHVVFNIGHHEPVEVREFVTLLEAALGRRAIVRYAPVHRGDVPVTCADVTRLRERTGFAPTTSLADGLVSFARWLEAWDPLPVRAAAEPPSPSSPLG
ncbi:MAG TPA: NAD-dependent epimerase/dehydratase family protein [Anaeromyxobacter sp.]